MIRVVLFIAATLTVAAPALAQEPVGCGKLKWPLERERALLASPTPMRSGATMPQAVGTAVSITLVPDADAKLPAPPSRPPKAAGRYAGFINAAAVPNAGTYRVTLSAAAWIDVVQNVHTLQSAAFSGASGCAGIAKSVKFELVAAPFTVELSGASATALTFVVTPD
jgi:hypothetical protein